MRRIHLTGMSGAGKSTALAELARRGLAVVDADGPEHAEWSAAAGGMVWREAAIEALLAEQRDVPLVVAGCVSNQGRFRAAFDAVVLLDAPAGVLLDRVEQRTGNSFGKRADERERIEQDIAHGVPLLRASCTHAIDATLPPGEVADAIEAIARGSRLAPAQR